MNFSPRVNFHKFAHFANKIVVQLQFWSDSGLSIENFSHLGDEYKDFSVSGFFDLVDITLN